MPGPLDVRVDRDSEVPLGAQLAEQILAAVADGRLRPRDRLPSVRELADGAGVNVNTVRSVYARLEAEGLVRGEHGRGTFVADPAEAPTGLTRSELRDQITALEATLVRLPPPPLPAEPAGGRTPAGAALQSTEELREIRDRLLRRLQDLDTERAAVIQSLDRLGAETRPAEAPANLSAAPSSRRSTPSLAGARIRWVGARA
jgi:DNA-binding transcriptional regulator YhcF (GntR family)